MVIAFCAAAVRASPDNSRAYRSQTSWPPSKATHTVQAWVSRRNDATGDCSFKKSLANSGESTSTRVGDRGDAEISSTNPSALDSSAKEAKNPRREGGEGKVRKFNRVIAARDPSDPYSSL